MGEMKFAPPEKVRRELWAETARYLMEKAERTNDPIRQSALLDQAARAEREVQVARWLLADGIAVIVTKLWGSYGWAYRNAALQILTGEGGDE